MLSGFELYPRWVPLILIHIIFLITIIIIVAVVANATSQIRFLVNQLQRIRFVCSRLICNLS